mgnify:CR=1 FL=1
MDDSGNCVNSDNDNYNSLNKCIIKKCENLNVFEEILINYYNETRRDLNEKQYNIDKIKFNNELKKHQIFVSNMNNNVHNQQHRGWF